MKKIIVPLLLFFLTMEIFARNLTALERQIIMAGPEEMLSLIMDRHMEKEMLSIYNSFADLDSDEIISGITTAFPGTSEEECLFLIIKLVLVVSLGSGDEDGLETGLDILEFLSEIDSITGTEELPEDIKTFMKSSCWKDCIEFYRLFDPESFLRDRFPEYF